MEKREKIILGLMAVAICYGLYHFLFSSSGMLVVGPEKNVEELTAFLAGIGAKLGKDDTSKIDSYILDLAAKKWENDPFVEHERYDLFEKIQPENPTREKGKATEKETPLVYSGYIMAGDKIIAIINGIEYETNEPMEQLGLTVQNISTSRVVVTDGKGNKRIIPIEETM